MVGREQTETNDLSIMETAQQNILIVKLGAFGNIILLLGAFAVIRQHQARARISVLTSVTYAAWLRTFPYFDESLVDRRPAGWDFQTVHQFGRMLANGHFGRVDDLQTSTRSSPPNLVYLPVESVLESLTA